VTQISTLCNTSTCWKRTHHF